MSIASIALGLAASLTAFLALSTITEAAAEPLDAARVAAVAAMLPDAPQGLGSPITDRDAWDKLAAADAYKRFVKRAEELLGEPIPEQPDDLYLEFSRNGNRTRWQRVAGERRGRVPTLVLAECAENKGRFIPAIEEIVEALCTERTWVMPAHDRTLTNFNEKIVDIDLASSAVGWTLATANYLLGDKLSEGTRETIRENVERRVLIPYRDMFTGLRGPNWWMNTTNNWNSVCLAGVTGAALSQLGPARERAEFVVAAETYSRNFLRGFTPDGYCSEGLGYWNYGFGHYVLLAETIQQATSGGVDLLMRPEVKAPASFGARIQIIGGVAPAFADCSVSARLGFSTTYFVNRRLGLGLSEYDEITLEQIPGTLFESVLFAFPNSASETAPAGGAQGPELRSWFEQAGILISRPGAGSSCRMGVALKGGHNGEHHNHNDVGSYVVVMSRRPVLLDPGAETYTARTFSNQRYESKLLNSYGHPVPVLAGKLQRTGANAKAKVIRADFGDETDTLQLDLKAAYDVPELERMERTFAYSRADAGSLTVTDVVEFDSPQTFETAVLTGGGWKQMADGSLIVYDVDEAVRVKIDTEGAAFTLSTDQIHEDAAVHPVRIAITLDEPVESATVSLTITPADTFGEDETGGLLRNGGFEFESFGWSLPGNGLGEISDEQAASGEYSLKITDQSDKMGSNVSSARMPADGDAEYRLSGEAFHVSGEGIGMYVKYYNAAGEQINDADERGNIPSIGTLKPVVDKWEPFEFAFKTPADTAEIALWIHSYNGAQVEAYLDDLKVEKVEGE